MENLTLLGLIYLIAGAILAIFLPITLILTIFGIILVVMGKYNTPNIYSPYPMFQPCPDCSRNVGPSSQKCPYCGTQLAAEPAPGYNPTP